MSDSDLKRAIIAALLRCGKEHSLDTFQLICVGTQAMAALAEAALTAKTIQSASMMSPLEAAQISVLDMSIGTPDEPEAEDCTYYFDSQTRKYHVYCGTSLRYAELANVPFCTWLPADRYNVTAKAIRWGENANSSNCGTPPPLPEPGIRCGENTNSSNCGTPPPPPEPG